ncbi:GDSL-type esterase/lipase family protein [uncultured Brachyspira sp.]|uniref:GDSL-type esterase/lipase family protein n=1 Tax=uncultured Brachyspira sp. TaxID=221953 RepID=UPI00260015C6|nr:GDSL-type esterase/lipase family protein [uncultured Brachyspira sp.]
MKIVCLGDSTTYGYMVNRKQVWTSILNSKFENSNIQFINKGINGDTISSMYFRFDNDVINEKPNTLILMGGVNDIFLFKPLENIKKSFVDIINKSKENNIDIITFTPIPFIKEDFTFFKVNNLEEMESILVEYVNFINSYAKENNIKCIDVYDMFINKILKEHKYYDLYFDGVHLNSEGHNIFSYYLFEKLKEYIE